MKVNTVNLKSITLILFFNIIILVSCKNSKLSTSSGFFAQAPGYAGGKFSPGNSNKNPNWDWTKEGLQGIDRQETLYFSIDWPVPHNKYLPFAGMEGGPASSAFNIYHDMEKNKGWVLLTKNFGDANYEAETPKYPFFILYNRMRGIIRIFYYYSEQELESFTFGEVTLSHPNGEGKSAYMSWFRPDNTCLDDYLDNANQEDNGMTVTNANRLATGWNWADFSVGYSPEIETDSIMMFNFEGVIHADITFDGTLKLDEYTEVVGSINISCNDRMFDALDGLSFSINPKDFQTANDEAERLKEKEMNYNQGGIVKKTIIVSSVESNVRSNYFNNDFVHSTGSNAFLDSKRPASKAWGAIAQALWTFGKFIHAYSTAPTSEDVIQMGYTGKVSLEGESIEPHDIGGDIKIQTPGATHTDISDNAYETYYDKPLGVFALKTKPKLGWTMYSPKVGSPILDDTVYIGLLEPLQVVINPALYEEFNGYKYKVLSVEASYVWNDVFVKMRPWNDAELAFFGGDLIDRQNIDILETHDNESNSFVPIDKFFYENNFFYTKTLCLEDDNYYYMRRLQLELLSWSCDGEEFNDTRVCLHDNPDYKFEVPFPEGLAAPYIIIKVTVEPDPPIPGHLPVGVAKKYKAEWHKDPDESDWPFDPDDWILDPLKTKFNTPCEMPAVMNGGEKVECCN